MARCAFGLFRCSRFLPFHHRTTGTRDARPRALFVQFCDMDEQLAHRRALRDLDRICDSDRRRAREGISMDFSLTDEQRTLVATVRRFIAVELAPLEDEIERTGVLRPELAKTVHEKAKALGLYAMNIPTELGGGGLSAVDTMLVEEQFGRTSDILVRRAFGNVYEVLL